MTEYNKIESELISLGWTPKPGDGDHFKFKKEGNPNTIVISMSVGGRSRSMLNCIADIRKAEPLFRPNACHLKRLEIEKKDPENGLPEWMQKDCPVRYTSPEKRDWRKLKDENSVMNIKYIVCHIHSAEQDGTHKVIIRQADDPDSTLFTVKSDELDAWETAECTICYNRFPVNVLLDDEDENNLCPECAALLEKEKAEEAAAKKEEVKESRPKKDSDEVSTIVDSVNDIMENYKDVPISSLPPSVLQDVNRRIKERIEGLPSDVVRRLRKRAPNIFRFLEDSENKNVTPYEAWTAALEVLCSIRIRIENTKGMKEKDKVRKDIFQTSYSFKKKDVGNRKMDLVVIQAKNWANTKLVWQCQDIIMRAMKQAFPEDHEVVLLLECPSEGIRQYLIRPDDEIDDILKWEDEMMMARSHTDWKLTPQETIAEEIKDFINKASGVENFCEKANMTIIRNIDGGAEAFDFEKAHYETYLIIDDTAENDGDAFNKMLEEFGKEAKDNPGHFSETVRIYVRSIKWDGWEKKGNFNFVHKETVTGPDDLLDVLGTEILSIYERTDGTINIDSALTSQTQEDVERFKERLEEYLSENEGDPKVALIKQIFNTEKPKNNNTMPEKNSLELTNPASSNAAAGALTTRELLRELKERGVTFQGVEVPVVTRQSVNMDEI